MRTATESMLDGRLAHLRKILYASPKGRETMRTLAPASVLPSSDNMVDFCDWSQFSQWPQSA